MSSGATARSTNFIVTVNASPEDAQRLAQWAEAYRKQKALDWLGEEMPSWSTPCPLRVTFGQMGNGGATSFSFMGGEPYQTMHVEGTPDRVIASVLPHEITHTVFAHYFRRPVPRWADEGGAVLSEDEQERRQHEAYCYQCLSSRGRFLPLSKLFAQRQYGADPLPLYAEGYSVSAYLVGLKDRKTFLQFVDSGMQNGWSHALQRYYGFQSPDDLQQRWVANCLGIFRRRQQQQPAVQQPRPVTPPTAIGPTAIESSPVLAKISSDIAALVDAHKNLNAGQVNNQNALDQLGGAVQRLKDAQDGISKAIAGNGGALAGVKQDLAGHANILQNLQGIATKAGPILDSAAAIAANPATSSLLSLLGPAGIAAAGVLGSLGGGWMVVRKLKPLTGAVSALTPPAIAKPPTGNSTPAPPIAGGTPSLDLAGLEQMVQQALSNALQHGAPPLAALPQVAAPPAPQTPKSVYVPTPSTDVATMKKLFQQVLDTEAQKNPGTAGQMAKLRAWLDQLESGTPIS